MRKNLALTTAQLQNFIKRDPRSYRDEFLLQYSHFDSLLELFKLNPAKENEKLCELLNLLSHVRATASSAS